jgi:hypothetical protein
MKQLEIVAQTGWTDDKGNLIIIKTRGISIDDAVDNSELFSVDEDGNEKFYSDGMHLHPDTIESMIYSAWMEAVEKDLDEGMDDENH